MNDEAPVKDAALIPISENDTAMQRILSITKTYDEKEQKAAYRTIVLLTQIKTIQTKVDDGSQWGKKVTRQLNVYEATVLYEICKAYNLSPLMNFVIFLEGNQVYITLQGHLQNAHQTGQFVGIDIEEIKMEGARNYGYKATTKKMMDGVIQEFPAYGYSNDGNVRGSNKKDEVAMAQMAEARAMRRSLSRAFPIGLPYLEDFNEDPNFETPATNETLPTWLAGKLSAGKTAATPEEMLAAAKVEPVAKPAVEKAPAKPKTLWEVQAEVTDSVAEPTPEPAPKPATKTPAAKRDGAAMLAKIEAESKAKVEETKKQPEVGTAKSVSPEDEPLPALKPGIDQLNRIRELMEKLGVELPAIENCVKENAAKDRDYATKTISWLVEQVAEMERKATEEVDPTEVFGEDAIIAEEEVEAEVAPEDEILVDEIIEDDEPEAEDTPLTQDEAILRMSSMREKLSFKMREYNDLMSESPRRDDAIDETMSIIKKMRSDLQEFKAKYKLA